MGLAFFDFTPDTQGIAAFLAGLVLVLWALGLTERLRLGSFGEFTRPEKTWAKTLLALAGLALVAFAFVRARSTYLQTVSQSLIWQLGDSDRAVQVASDGGEVYVLTEAGQVHRVEGRRAVLIDKDTSGTRQIVSAGGVLYLLKNTGNVWSIVPQKGLEQLHFAKIDDGTRSTQIEVAGETVYVLKESGQLWRRVAGSEWVQEESPGIIEIASSGNILYFLTVDRCVGAYFPQAEAHVVPQLTEGEEPPPTWHRPECPLEAKSGPLDRRLTVAQRANELLARCGPAETIAVDGRVVYLIDSNRTAKKCQDGVVKEIYNPSAENGAREIDVAGGVVFVLTSRDEIWRIRGKRTHRYKGPSSEDGIALDRITATPYGCFAVDIDGSVWHFSEQLRTRF